MSRISLKAIAPILFLLNCAPLGAPSDGTTSSDAAPGPAPDALATDGAHPARALPDAGAAPQPTTLTDGAAPPPPAPTPPHPSARHARCGWIAAGDAVGNAAFIAHAEWFDAIHPDWWAFGADGVTPRMVNGADDPAVLAAAAAHGVAVIPLVVGVEDVSVVRATLNDPQRRTAHVQALVALAQTRGYAGLDIDYEHLWDPGDRAPYTAFAVELGAAMHAAGKLLTLAVPAIDQENPNNAWSYPDLIAAADYVHLMGYDFHSLGTHPGPTAPLGWVDAVAAHVASTGHAEKFILGLPNYGVTPSWFCPLADCAAACTGPLATTTDHMASCSYGNYAPGRSLNCPSTNGPLFFDDTQSLEEKVQSAKAHGLGGITYWTVGSEPPGFFEMVQRHY